MADTAPDVRKRGDTNDASPQLEDWTRNLEAALEQARQQGDGRGGLHVPAGDSGPDGRPAVGRTGRLLSPSELEELAQARVQAELENLTGVALIQAFKLIREMVRLETQTAEDNSPETDVLDIVANLDLPEPCTADHHPCLLGG